MVTNSISISSHDKNYHVTFISDINNVDILFDYKFTIIDKHVWRLYKTSGNPFVFNAEEKYKTVESSLEQCEWLLKNGIKRNDQLVSVGGGITQDVTGFTANIINRGLQWIYVPTTLLAQCDSCIGSKTSLNFGNYKNILGTFYHPTEVIICTKFLKTLPIIDYYSGFGEIVKFSIILKENYIEKLYRHANDIDSRNDDVLNDLIYDSLCLKKEYIEKDEFDWNIRQHLNYGHTFGHAIESITNYRIPHGLAVLIGITYANKISNALCILNNDIKTLIDDVCKTMFNKSGLDFDNELKKLNIDDLLLKTKKDKKNTSDSNDINMILLNNNYELFKKSVCVHDIKEIFA